MSTGFERRARRLREHVLAHSKPNDITKDEIIKKLNELGIEHNPRDKKDDLMKLLVDRK